MALTKCQECGNEVSTHATACPTCGYPMAGPTPMGPLAECEYCKKMIAAELTVCPHCNVQVFKTHRKQSTQVPTPQPRKKSQAHLWLILLGLLLVGSFISTANSAKTAGETRASTPAQPTTPVVDSPPKLYPTLELKRGAIYVGMTSDDFLRLVKPIDIVSQHQGEDPEHPGSLLVVKRCCVGNTAFTVAFGRAEAFGPYRIISISEVNSITD